MATTRKSVVLPLALSVLGLGLTALTHVAGATHPRPVGATPIRVSLVPAYNACTAPDRTHGPPLAFSSCNPPGQGSSFLTVGTPDANGAGAKSVGFMKIKAVRIGSPGPPDDDTNIEFTLQITDVRCKAGATPCGNANAAGGPDYTGEVQGNATIRMTDHWNAVAAGGGPDPATVIDFPAPVRAVCSNTADTSIGAFCTISSTTEALMFPFACGCEGKRVVYAWEQVRVSDGGPDGLVASEPQDNTDFMKQGLFIP